MNEHSRVRGAELETNLVAEENHQQAVELLARRQAVAAIKVKVQVTAPIALRWRQLNAIFRLATGLELLSKMEQDDSIAHRRWARLKDIAE